MSEENPVSETTQTPETPETHKILEKIKTVLFNRSNVVKCVLGENGKRYWIPPGLHSEIPTRIKGILAKGVYITTLPEREVIRPWKETGAKYALKSLAENRRIQERSGQKIYGSRNIGSSSRVMPSRVSLPTRSR